jgi:hypothetical protein
LWCPVSLPRMPLTQAALPRWKPTAIQGEPEEQKVLSGRRQPLPEGACRQLCHNFADGGLHQPMKGDGKDDVDPKAESDPCCQPEILPP